MEGRATATSRDSRTTRARPYPTSSPRRSCGASSRRRPATSAVAHEDAAGLYARALSVLPEEARWDRERAELEVLRGEALWRSGDLVEADDAFNAAASHARRLGRSDLLARAALGRAGPQADVWMKPAHVQSLDEALRCLPTADDALRVRVLARLALELYYSEHVDRRRG